MSDNSQELSEGGLLPRGGTNAPDSPDLGALAASDQHRASVKELRGAYSELGRRGGGRLPLPLHVDHSNTGSVLRRTSYGTTNRSLVHDHPDDASCLSLDYTPSHFSKPTHSIQEQKNQSIAQVGHAVVKLRLRKIELKERVSLQMATSVQGNTKNELLACETELQEAVKLFIELQVAVDTLPIDPNGLEAQINQAKAQLQALLRSGRMQLNESKSKRNWMGWWYDADQAQIKHKALLSLQHFAKNPALEVKLDTDADLDAVRLELLRSLSNAFFVMMNLNVSGLKDVRVSSTSGVGGLRAQNDVEESVEDSFAEMNNSYLSDRMGDLTAEHLVQINAEIVRYVKDTLLPYVRTQAEKIGHKNDRLQFWGNALMALATAITLMMAVAAVVTVTGVTVPSVLMTYVAALKANTLVSTALYYVAAKLSTDLSTAAAVTAVSTAGLLAAVGKFSHHMGETPALKRDVDAAVDHIQAVIESPKFGQ